jgi:hypothetical protein
MLVFCGLPLSDQLNYFTSVDGRVGLINSAAQSLLRATNIDANTQGTVTLSWFKIDCTSSEAITDVLRMSSPLQSGKGPDPNLVLRELGKGRGMVVPGLWEVELTKPSDADAVISHVQRMLPSAVHDGSSHTIFQLTVAPNTTNYKNRHTGGKSQIVEDTPGLGRLTIVLLSNISSTLPSIITTPQTKETTIHNENFPWVTQLTDILRWIESKRPSPPFHKSRILLLLRDALCNRMQCTISLLMSPIIDALAENFIWLQIISHINNLSNTNSKILSTLNLNNITSAGINMSTDPFQNISNNGNVSSEHLLAGNFSHPGSSLMKGIIPSTSSVANHNNQSVKDNANVISTPGNVKKNMQNVDNLDNNRKNLYLPSSSRPSLRPNKTNNEDSPHASHEHNQIYHNSTTTTTNNNNQSKYNEEDNQYDNNITNERISNINNSYYPYNDNTYRDNRIPQNSHINIDSSAMGNVRSQSKDDNMHIMNISDIPNSDDNNDMVDTQFTTHELEEPWDGDNDEFKQQQRQEQSKVYNNIPIANYEQQINYDSSSKKKSSFNTANHHDWIEKENNIRLSNSHHHPIVSTNMVQSSMHIPPPPPHIQSQHNQSSLQQTQYQQEHQHQQQTQLYSQQQMQQSYAVNRSVPQGEMYSNPKSESLDSEGIRALLDALETSRMEVSSLKRALIASQERYVIYIIKE